MFSYFFVALLKEGGALVLCRATTPTEQLLFSKNTWRFETDVVGVEATSDAPYALGTEYTCDLGDGERTFYVLEDGDNTTLTTGTTGTAGAGEVALILEKNYDTTGQYWCDPNGENPTNNVCNADGLTGKLDEIARVWSKLDRDQIGLPSAMQIVAADGKSELVNYMNITNDYLYSWSDYPKNQLYGYWTSTPNTENSSYAWTAAYQPYYDIGELCNNYMDFEVYYNVLGLRPIITISKNNISF